MEAAAEADDRLASGRRASDLDRVLHGLGAGAEEDRLLGQIAWSQLANSLGQPKVRLVHHDLERGVRDAVQLFVYGGHDARVVVADVHDADPTHEVDVVLA